MGINERDDGVLDNGCRDSDIAILLSVEAPEEVRTCAYGPQVTELLVYASASPCPLSQPAGIFTPPRSSSPNPDGREHSPATQPLNVKIYALPLSSQLFYKHNLNQAPPSPPRSDASLPRIEARFLPPQEFSTSRKRQRLNSLFDGAAQQTKRMKRHGGQKVGKMMATSKPQSPTAIAYASKDARPQQQPPMRVRRVPKPPLRSQSTGCMQEHKETHSRRSHSRSYSGTGALARTQRSSLHRVTSMGDIGGPGPTGGDSHMPDLPESILNTHPQMEATSFQAKNKNALSRVIMAGMRMHGLSQRKKTFPPPTPIIDQEPSSRPTTASGTTIAAGTPSLEDEYKLVYHQTYKAAAFTLRREIGSCLVSQERMRDVSDVLLNLFCRDSTTAGGGLEEGHDVVGATRVKEPFDRPSVPELQKGPSREPVTLERREEVLVEPSRA
ncbi:MAG: hypothetical protein LQ340_000592 [Diploschistes diacapsis]|nr:MAG: hypothetical protein LQ340_000592 [Diploschistes diacapsis]